MEELKDFYAEPIKVFANDDIDIERDFFYDLVYKYGKAIRRAVKLNSRYVEAVETLLVMEWDMVYGSVNRDFSTEVKINKKDDTIHVSFCAKSMY